MATTTFGLSSSVVNSNKTYSGSDADSVALLDWASGAYSAKVLAQPATVKCTASISGTTMTVTAVASGNLMTNQYVYGPGVLPGTRITNAPGSGPGASTNCPASTLTTVYDWIKVTSRDGSTVYIPCWK
jgi:hypothetical protein